MNQEMTKQYLIGVDLGTSATKTILIDESGTIVASASCAYPMYQPENGWAEQNPQDWKNAALATIKEVMKTSGVAAGESVCRDRCTGLSCWMKRTNWLTMPSFGATNEAVLRRKKCSTCFLWKNGLKSPQILLLPDGRLQKYCG